MDIPTIKEFNRGVEARRKHEKRDAMYKVASFLISHFWEKKDFAGIANGLGVLLLTWNQAFYRYGAFDFNKLEGCIKNNYSEIKKYRNSDISTLSSSDEKSIKRVFNEFLEALQIDAGKSKGRKSPVSVAKAIHLLAPKFFPLWDDKIARAYGCYYNKNSEKCYIRYSKIMKDFSEKLKGKVLYKDWSLLKIIDEYNYSKYTKHWI